MDVETALFVLQRNSQVFVWNTLAAFEIFMDGKNISIDNLNSHKASYTIENHGINIF